MRWWILVIVTFLGIYSDKITDIKNLKHKADMGDQFDEDEKIRQGAPLKQNYKNKS